MGNPNLSNPYWGKAIQYQQRGQQQQAKPQGKPQQQQQGRQNKPQEDFSKDWRYKRTVTKVAEGATVTTVEGVVEDVSRYWIKLRVGNEVLYLNKAHIISIKVVEVKDAGDANVGCLYLITVSRH
jgi:hypothetical protein